MIYLIDYDWRAGKLVTLSEFADGDRSAADEARTALELRLLGEGLDREIVILEALDESGLRQTHSRYFKSLEELLSKAGND